MNNAAPAVVCNGWICIHIFILRMHELPSSSTRVPVELPVLLSQCAFVASAFPVKRWFLLMSTFLSTEQVNKTQRISDWFTSIFIAFSLTLLSTVLITSVYGVIKL